MRIVRNVFINKKNNQFSITLPKKKIEKEDKVPVKIILNIERVQYLPLEKKDKKEDLFSLK